MPHEPIVEVRIPAYNRLDLLRRALISVRQQTHETWRAIVLDDGDAGPTRDLVAALGDPRILHRPNPSRLGAGPNISQAFSATPLAGGAFFCVLEDDNLFLPSYLADNLALMAEPTAAHHADFAGTRRRTSCSLVIRTLRAF